MAKIVKDAVLVDLHQHEFDALVSFAYNPAGEFHNVANYINRGEVNEALRLINSKTKSGGVVLKGLVKRRQREVALYRNAEYGE